MDWKVTFIYHNILNICIALLVHRYRVLKLPIVNNNDDETYRIFYACEYMFSVNEYTEDDDMNYYFLLSGLFATDKYENSLFSDCKKIFENTDIIANIRDMVLVFRRYI